MDKLRTELANERTLLAYVRTALALMVFGMAAIKFFPENSLIVGLGWLFLLGGMAGLSWGVAHFRKVAKRINREKEKVPKEKEEKVPGTTQGQVAKE